MFGNLGRLGYLYIAEKKVKGELKVSIKKLKANSGWADSVAAFSGDGSPAYYKTALSDIERKIPGASITNLRYWNDALKGLTKVASAPVPLAPMPAPAPAPAPLPPPKPAPAPEPKVMPAAPAGLKCPHYTQGSAFPDKHDDPAAVKRYLDKYEDVKGWTKVMKERFKGKGLNALWHYRCYGKNEGRTWAGLEGIHSRIPGYLR